MRAGSLFGLVITGLFVGIDKLDDIFEDIIDRMVKAINDSTLNDVLYGVHDINFDGVVDDVLYGVVESVRDDTVEGVVESKVDGIHETDSIDNSIDEVDGIDGVNGKWNGKEHGTVNDNGMM